MRRREGRSSPRTKKICAGAKGEREAAYEIDFDYAKNPNRAVIHDLRLEVDGRVAQIDHLIIDPILTIWVCESKHFSEGVGIDEHGEWVAYFGGRPHGIPSPIEQNRKHIAVLQDVFDQKLVEPKKRLGITIKPQFRSVILVSNGARISRPRAKAAAAAVAGLDTVFKVEKLQSMILKDIDARSIASIRRVVSTETITRLATDLVALHRPIAVDWRPDSDYRRSRRAQFRRDRPRDGKGGSASPAAALSLTAWLATARNIPLGSAAASYACAANRL